MTWGESHGPAVGVVIDGVPAGMMLSEEDIQSYLDRRKPGTSEFTTKRSESDTVSILSGVFEGRTEGSPISLLVKNSDAHSKDYSDLAHLYRPGHADYCFSQKYGFRDYRGGGRSSGRETIGRVAAGAVAAKFLSEFSISVFAYTKSIGDVEITSFDPAERDKNPLFMPDKKAAEKASEVIRAAAAEKDSVGGVIECRISGLPAGIGEPVFDKIDAALASACLSIGACKGFAIGDGFGAARLRGSENNDPFCIRDGKVVKESNHSGGTLGGISDGSEIQFCAAFKPTPSIARPQKTVTEDGRETTVEIHGRHDPTVVPRAVVVVESMAALTCADLLLASAGSRLENLKKLF